MQDAIVAEGLTVVRGKTPTLQDVSCTVLAGAITGLIGPSGSGKTTLMRAIIGTQRITSGTVTVLGKPAGAAALRRQIGYVTQSPAVYDDLNAWQNLAYFAAVLGVGKPAIGQALQAVDLQAHAKQLVGTMSGGERARVSLAIALLGEPPLLVLDEPTVGLDPVLRQKLWELFGQLAEQGRTLLISSHVMDEAERCPNLLLLRDGKVLHSGSRSELTARTKTTTVQDAFLALASGDAR